MKVKVVHDVCEREVLVQQILESGGHCPWDGKPFSVDYTAILAEALATMESAGNVLENALEKISEMEPKMRIDRESLLAAIDAHVEALNGRKRSR